MQICHIIEAAAGGSGQVVINLLKMGIAAGDDLTLIYSPVRADSHFLTELELLRGCVKIHTLPMRRSVGLHDLYHCLRLAFLMRRIGNFDIINSHSSKAGAISRIVGLICPRGVQIYTPHAFITMSPTAPKIYGLMERVLSHICEAVICGSEQERMHAQNKLRIQPSKLFIAYNGVSMSPQITRSAARDRLGFTGNEYVVGFVGRLVEQKNPLRLIEAFSLAARHLPQLRLAIVGDGHLQNVIKQAIESKQLQNRIVLLSGYNARNIMPGFDCFLCSSDYESFGLVIIEALAAGVPVISTPVGVATEAIVANDMLISIDFGVESLAKSIITLAGMNSAERSKKSQTAQRIASFFSIENMAASTKGIYAQCLGKH